MKTVPQIPLKEMPEYERLIIPKGTYKAKIIEVTEPRALRTRENMFSVGFNMEIQFEGHPRKVWQFYTGYAPITSMLWRNRKLWIGTEVDVQVRIKQFADHTYNDALIVWPEETLDVTG